MQYIPLGVLISRVNQPILQVVSLRGYFFSSVDAETVATSIVIIIEELGDADDISWLFLAYLLTYVGIAPCCPFVVRLISDSFGFTKLFPGFAIVELHLSDIFGRKDMLLLS